MKISIIGAGNMGGAIARALAEVADITVSNPSQGKLDTIVAECPSVSITRSNRECVRGADIILLAVKPWILGNVVEELRSDMKKCRAVVSVVAGIEPAELAALIGAGAPPCYYLIPNTAVAIGQGMSFISTDSADTPLDNEIIHLLEPTGKVLKVPVNQMTAGMAVASCGIAYAMRYVRAAAQGGVQLGLYPETATAAVAATLRGAAALLETRGLHPEQEIDRVTTPGGITIRGLNAMESAGFTAAVIAGITASKP